MNKAVRPISLAGSGPKSVGVVDERRGRDRHHTNTSACDASGNPAAQSRPSRGSLVSVVDDDESVRESLPDLIQEFGYSVRAFSSGEEFLASDALDHTRCLVLDIAMPGMSGPDLQDELSRRGKKIPIVFITANRDEADRSKVLARGAVECLYKPFSDTALLAALQAAL